MSKYTQLTLQPNERIIVVARLHWIIYVRALTYFTFSLAVLIASYLAPFDAMPAASIVAGALAANAVRIAVKAWWSQFTTEMAVTNKRVVLMKGFIWRHSNEMFLSRIESVIVDQDVVGRFLNFGSIHCRGVGEGIEHLHHIADPIEIQAAITAV